MSGVEAKSATASQPPLHQRLELTKHMEHFQILEQTHIADRVHCKTRLAAPLDGVAEHERP